MHDHDQIIAPFPHPVNIALDVVLIIEPVQMKPLLFFRHGVIQVSGIPDKTDPASMNILDEPRPCSRLISGNAEIVQTAVPDKLHRMDDPLATLVENMVIAGMED